MKTNQLDSGKRDLIRRYLIWCYKTTKESFDRIERYFTQEVVDKHILAQLKENIKEVDSEIRNQYEASIRDFEEYIKKKVNSACEKKYADSKHTILKSEFLYLKNRLAAIEKAITHFLGVKALCEVRDLYEKEMTRRIIQSTEHT